MRWHVTSSRSRARSARRLGPGARVLLAIAVALCRVGSAGAHGDASPNVRALVVAADLPPALRGMRFAVERTIAPQLALENPTRRTVEVLDPDGVAFLRVGPGGVEGNLAAAAWYTTYSPGSAAPAGRAEPPRWVRVREQPSFGWFDPRLDPAHVRVPERVRTSGRVADVGRWRIALRVDGKPVALEGRFRFEPPPTASAARLTSPAEIAPGVRVKLLPGRVPGLLVENGSQEPVVVLGGDGEPFLRIGPGGVDGNACSATFRASARAPSAAASDGDAAACASGATRWHRVAATPRFGWVEPRAAPPGEGAPRAAEARAVAVHRWSVPVEIGGARSDVTGVTTPGAARTPL